MELLSNNKLDGSSSLLAPGFRFHPTDEELVRYYLKRKICGKGFRFDAISEIDIYKAEPWDLPSMSKLKTRDLEWYFFSFLDKKYGNGARTNRATEKGYWKTTGKDRAVYHRAQIVGMKKTLVYHNGRAPKGLRTNWVMHEYRLTDLECVGVVKDAFVLCRVFQKSGSGPKNGEQYGAPFVEEEWENDELEVVPKGSQAVEEVDFGDDAYLDGFYLEQILQSEIASDTVPLPLNCHSTDANYVQETVKPENGTQHVLECVVKQNSEPEQQLDNFNDLSALLETELQPVKDEYIGESSKSANYDDLDLEFLLDEQFHDAYDGFIETNDFANTIDISAVDMLDEYLMNDDKSQQYLAYDPPVFNTGSEKPVYDALLLPQKEPYEGTQQAAYPNGQGLDYNINDAALPSDKQELTRCQSGYQYQFIKQASQMLGNIPAPPAFAAEFPSKEAILRLNSVAQSKSTVHMVQIRNSSSGKNENKFNVVLSFGYARGEDGSSSLESSVSIPSGKNLLSIFRGMFHSKFFWVLVLSMSFQIGTCVLAH